MEQNTLKGISIYAFAAFFVICMTAFGKALGDLGYHPIEIVFYRSFGGLILISAYIIAFKKYDVLKTSRPLAHLGRSALGNTGIALWFWAVSILPLSTATSISYIAPIIVTAFSALLLKEKVGRYKWGAVFFAFCGTLFLIQPSDINASQLGLTIAIVNAFIVAGISITLRSLGKSERALTTTFYFLLFGTIATGLILPFVWTSSPELGWLLFGLILTGFINQPMKTYAFRIASASSISPVQYFGIIWATIIGYIFWEDIPTTNVIIGCAIVVSSNFIIIWREKTAKGKS